MYDDIRHRQLPRAKQSKCFILSNIGLNHSVFSPDATIVNKCHLGWLLCIIKGHFH